MVREISVAEAKRSFSDLMARVVYKGDEYIIKRRGKPMLAIVKPEYLKAIHTLNKRRRTKGLIGIVGKFNDSQDFVEEIEKILLKRNITR
jgi:prevent-host-death family protein